MLAGVLSSCYGNSKTRYVCGTQHLFVKTTEHTGCCLFWIWRALILLHRDRARSLPFSRWLVACQNRNRLPNPHYFFHVHFWQSRIFPLCSLFSLLSLPCSESTEHDALFHGRFTAVGAVILSMSRILIPSTSAPNLSSSSCSILVAVNCGLFIGLVTHYMLAQKRDLFQCAELVMDLLFGSPYFACTAFNWRFCHYRFHGLVVCIFGTNPLCSLFPCWF